MPFKQWLSICLSPQPLAPTILLSDSVVLSTLTHVSGIVEYVSSCNWLISLSIISSRLTHVVACVNLLFKLTRAPLYGCIYYILSVPIEGHLGCLQVLAAVKNVATNGLYNYVLKILLSVMRVCAQEWNDGSDGSFIFNFWRKRPTVFQSGCRSARSHRRCSRAPRSPRPHRHYFFLCLS